MCQVCVRLALTDRDHTHPIGAFEPFRGNILVLLIPCGVHRFLSGKHNEPKNPSVAKNVTKR